MDNQKKIIKDILSLYETILNNKVINEAVDVYDNVDFKDNEVGNSTPSKDNINTSLLQDVQTAAKAAGVKVDITTAITGHDKGTRHESGNAVDISMINGIKVSPSNKEIVNKFVDALVSMGYVKNNELGNDKSVLTFGFPGHDNHVHISRKSKEDSSKTNNNPQDGSNTDNSKTSDFELKADPLVVSLAGNLLNTLNIKEEKIYTKFGQNTQTRRGSIIIPKEKNSNIKSPISGTIILSNRNNNCKNNVLIKHTIEQETYYLEYCGIARLSVRDGRKINKGDVIGTTDSDVNVTLYDSSKNKEYLDNFIEKESEHTDKRKKPGSTEDESVISNFLQLPFKPFQNKYDDSGKMIEKRWGSSTEKEQPVDWINRLSPTYKKKVTEDINRIKGLLK
jgi:hypothetical protein